MTQSHPQYRAETFQVQAGGSIEIHRSAEFVICLEASFPFKVAFDDAPKTNFEKGLSYEAQVAFTKIRIENPTESEMTISLGMGRGGIRDARFVVSGSVKTEFDAPAFIDTVEKIAAGAGVSTLIVGSDVRRKEAVIRNLSDTGEVWLRGDSGLTEGGYLLRAQEAAILTTSAAIYAYNSTGTPVDLTGLSIREEF